MCVKYMGSCVQEWATAKWGAECYERIDNSVPATQRHATVLRFNQEGRCDRRLWLARIAQAATTIPECCSNVLLLLCQLVPRFRHPTTVFVHWAAEMLL